MLTPEQEQKERERFAKWLWGPETRDVDPVSAWFARAAIAAQDRARLERYEHELRRLQAVVSEIDADLIDAVLEGEG